MPLKINTFSRRTLGLTPSPRLRVPRTPKDRQAIKGYFYINLVATLPMFLVGSRGRSLAG